MAELGRSVALERRIRAAGAGASLDAGDAAAAMLLATAKRVGLGDREIAALAGVGRARPWQRRGRRSGWRPGSRWWTRARPSSRPRRPTSTHLRGRGLAAGGAAGGAPRGARHRLGPGPDRAGDRVRLLRGPRRGEPALPRLGGGHGELQPGDGLDRLRRLLAPLLRAAGRGERARDRGRPRPRRAQAPLPAFVQFGGQTPLNLAAPLAAAGVPLLGASLETIDQAEDRVRFSALVERLGHPPARGRDGPLDRGGAGDRRADRLPGHRPARRSSSAGWRSTSPTPATTSSPSSPRRPSSTPTGRSGSTATSRASRWTWTRSPTARRS